MMALVFCLFVVVVAVGDSIFYVLLVLVVAVVGDRVGVMFLGWCWCWIFCCVFLVMFCWFGCLRCW